MLEEQANTACMWLKSALLQAENQWKYFAMMLESLPASALRNKAHPVPPVRNLHCSEGAQAHSYLAGFGMFRSFPSWLPHMWVCQKTQAR